MEHLAGTGDDLTPEDDDFTVAQDTEFDEPDEARDDEERALDDSLADEAPGIDEERRVDLADEGIAGEE